MTTTSVPFGQTTSNIAVQHQAKRRLASIDALRGLVIVIMLIDHIRDIFFNHLNISDPVDALTTEPDQFILRLLSSLCAPVFVLLTGISAYLYGLNHNKQQVAHFLFKRGLLLILLEITLISIAWTGSVPPSKLYLQVIWVIGLSMVIMAGLIYLPSPAQWLVVIAGITGHNLLDAIVLTPDHGMHTLWAILHQRDWLQITDTLSARTSYPLLPWPSVMLLGYLLGGWFKPEVIPSDRQTRLIKLGLALLAAFAMIRALNVYGDAPWFTGEHASITIMSFLALTKYPPSLLFIAFTLGVGLIVLACLERWQDRRILQPLVDFGSAPMFFYILHLYCIGISYLLCIRIFGRNYGNQYGFEHLWQLWMMFFALIFPLYFATRWFGRLKQRRRDIRWLKYF